MDPLISQLSHEEESERLYAVQDIMEQNENGKAYAVSLVSHLASETSQAVRESIVYALKMMPCEAAFPELFLLFQSPDAYLRNAAVTIFGTQQTPGVAFLTSQLDHADREVRKLVLDALFLIGSQESILAIRAGLKDPAINVKITAVEYLGQLNDQESVPDVLAMLENESEPMLVTSALETVLQMGDDAALQKTIQLLNENDDLLKVHPVFLPELIKLTARSGSLERLLELIDFINGRATYANDVIQAIETAQKRFDNLVEIPEMTHRLIKAVKSSQANEALRYAAAELLLNHVFQENADAPFTRADMETLGSALIDDPVMATAGVRFLHKSGSEAGKEKIETLMSETKVSTLRELCESLLS